MLHRLFPRPAVWCLCALAACLLALPGTALRGSGSKKRDPTIAVRFHKQVYAYDPTFTAKVSVGNPPHEIVVEKIPSLSERDIASFYPYQAADGSYSAVFQLDRHGSATLEAVSTENRGRALLVAVNGRPITTLMVDKTITDGVIYVPFGLTVADIRALGASFSLMGETDAEKEARRHPQQPTPALLDPANPVMTPKPPR